MTAKETGGLDPELQAYLGLGVILGTGLSLGGFAVYHALTTEIHVESLLYVLTPICFSAGLIAAGFGTWRREFEGADVLRIAGWVFVGVAVFGLLVTWTVTHQLIRGDSFVHGLFVTVTNMCFGGLVGVIIGWLDASNRRSERQLEAETEKLNRQNERLEEFASIVSHDLRNPLNVAMLHLRTAQEQTDHDSLDAMESSLSRMEDIVNDVLTMAREGGAVEETERVTLRDAAERSWAEVRTDGAELVVADNVAFQADPSLLGHVLENLFRNSVEHGATAGPESSDPSVTIRVGTLENGFYVEDDGPGIPEPQRGKLFDSGYSGTDDGSGFGLTIVQRMVQAHGWTITATDAEHDGAPRDVRRDGAAADSEHAGAIEEIDASAPDTGAAGARFEITGVEFTRQEATDVIDETWKAISSGE